MNNFLKAYEDERAELLENVKFRKQIFGGLSEEQVWFLIDRLEEIYERSFRDQEMYYKGLVQERDAYIRKLTAGRR